MGTESYAFKEAKGFEMSVKRIVFYDWGDEDHSIVIGLFPNNLIFLGR